MTLHIPSVSRVVGVALFGLVAACASATEDAAGSAAAVTTGASAEPIPRSEVPEPAAFVGWTDDTQTTSLPKPADVVKVKVDCASPTLYATHPQSILKRYHRYANGKYDHFKMSGDAEACKTPALYRNAQGKRACLAPDTLVYAMLSDTFADACGHTYRGYWEVTFLGSDENMGTLVSRGRTVYAKTSSEFAGDTYDGDTYPLQAKDFAFFSALADGDAAEIAKDRTAKTHRYDAATKLFTYVGPT